MVIIIFRVEEYDMDDKVRALLERIAADAAAGGARAAGRKAGQMVDVAKLNVQLFDLNGEYNDILRQLGQVMFDTHKGQVPEGAAVTALLDQADEKSAKIAELKGRIRSVPAADSPAAKATLSAATAAHRCKEGPYGLHDGTV